MPFEIAPEVEAPAKFADAADAMLRGCTLTHPLRGSMWMVYNGQEYACAIGAAVTGGCDESTIWRLRGSYAAHYGSSIEKDNDSGRFTREQIAERIRCL